MREGRPRRALRAAHGPVLAAAVLALIVACRSAPSDDTRIAGIDEDGDGRVDVWRTTGPDGRIDVRAPAPGSDPSRTVVLAIDAIPHALFADLQREGHFRGFFPASRLVAPFPSHGGALAGVRPQKGSSTKPSSASVQHE